VDRFRHLDHIMTSRADSSLEVYAHWIRPGWSPLRVSTYIRRDSVG
jgi:hypothetical protein